MNKQHPISMRTLAALYWFIVVSYSALEPWGRIDTRDFSYMGPYRFWEYNAFISFQLVSMTVLGFLLWRGAVSPKVLVWITAISAMFITINVFDLLHFFPDPAQPMPFLVALIEVIDSIVAFGILLYSQKIRGED